LFDITKLLYLKPLLMPKKLVNIGLAAEILKVKTETLRYWDKIGLLPAVRNKQNGYRMYDISKIQAFKEKHPQRQLKEE